MAKLYNFPNMTEGIDQGIEQISTQLIVFPVMILVFVWSLVFGSGMTLQMRRQGYADAPLWALISFLTIDFLALILTLGTNILNKEILGVIVGATVLTALWFFLSKGRFGNG